ncbi:MAG TPA: M48 family metalloprotease [Conexibacter sp.]|nr:M48 family metalloprotease [Conexibacter sp.]
MAIALLAAAPTAVLFFGLAHIWCRDNGWPNAVELPLALASLTALGWWWCGRQRQRQWIATFAQPMERDELPRLLPTLPEVQRRLACSRELEIWLLPIRRTNAFVIGNRQLVVTAGLAGEPPRRQAAILAHELAHLRLGHSLTCWALERCLLGYERVAVQTTRTELDSRVIPGSLVTAMTYALTFTVLAVPLLLLRLTGVALGRRMELEADRLAARCGYAEPLEDFFGGLVGMSEKEIDVGLYTVRARAHSHPSATKRHDALQSRRLPRAAAIVPTMCHAAASAGRKAIRVLRSNVALLLTPPIDCVVIVVSWCFADLGVLQSMMRGAFAGMPSLLPLALIALRGRPRRPIKRDVTLRVGLLLLLAGHAVVIADPSLLQEESVAGLLDVAWLVAAAAVALGVGVRAWLKALARGAGLLLLPGRYAQRLLRPPSAGPGGATQESATEARRRRV